MTNDTNERRFIADVMQEHARALAKFPGPNVNLAALTEEAGELAEAMAGYLLTMQIRHGRLARALLHHRENDPAITWEDVRKEAVQVAVMAMRVALEGDTSIAVPPQGWWNEVENREDYHQPVIRFFRFPTGTWKAVPSSGPIAGAWDLLRRDEEANTWDGIRNGVTMSELIGVVLNVKLPSYAPGYKPPFRIENELTAAAPARTEIQLRLVPGEPGYLITQARLAGDTGEWMYVATSDSIVTAHKAGEDYVNRRRDGATYVWVPYHSNEPAPQMDPVEYVIKDGVKVATTRPPAVQPFDEAQPGGICHTGHEWRFQGKGDGSKRCERCGEIATGKTQAVDLATAFEPVAPSSVPNPELTDLQKKELAIAYSTDRPITVAETPPLPPAAPADQEPAEPKPVTWTCKITPRTGSDTFDVHQWNGKKWTVIAADMPGPYARGIFERRMREAGLHIEVDPDTGAAAANPDLRKGVIKKIRDELHRVRKQTREQANEIMKELRNEAPDLQHIRRMAETLATI